MSNKVRLFHPLTNRTILVSEKAARVHRRSGWVDADTELRRWAPDADAFEDPILSALAADFAATEPEIAAIWSTIDDGMPDDERLALAVAHAAVGSTPAAVREALHDSDWFLARDAQARLDSADIYDQALAAARSALAEFHGPAGAPDEPTPTGVDTDDPGTGEE